MNIKYYGVATRNILNFSSLEVISAKNAKHYLKLRAKKMKDVKTANKILLSGIQEIETLENQNRLLKEAVRRLSYELYNKQLDLDTDLI